MTEQDNTTTLVAEHTADIVSAFVANNTVDKDDLPGLISSVGAAFKSIYEPEAGQETAEVYEGAVSVRKSLANPDHIISMIDGKPYKMLTRHLTTNGLTPEQYRERYNLPADYPMTAPNYSQKRRELAKQIGLGRKPGERPAKK